MLRGQYTLPSLGMCIDIMCIGMMCAGSCVSLCVDMCVGIMCIGIICFGLCVSIMCVGCGMMCVGIPCVVVMILLVPHVCGKWYPIRKARRQYVCVTISTRGVSLVGFTNLISFHVEVGSQWLCCWCYSAETHAMKVI